MMRTARAVAVLIVMLFVTADLPAVPAPTTTRALLLGNVERPLRYRPDGHDFVIENGPEYFNRPLYGSNTAFRVDAGDRPELSLYLPGRGGNLRLGIGRKWLHDAATIEARYRPGSMLYEIRDPDIRGKLSVAVLGMWPSEGVILRVTLTEAYEPIELLIAYGGVNGQRGRRDGDVGTESQPVSRYFQLRPEFCDGNTFEFAGGRFVLTSKAALIAGSSSVPARYELADAAQWNDVAKLLDSAGRAPVRSVVLGRMTLRPDEPLYFALDRLTNPARALRWQELKRAFDEAENWRQTIASQIEVETPDPYINAAAAALCVAADGTWDEQQTAVMHGAVAWRSRLLGWRGVYWCDALGYHERTRQHLSNWLPRQNDDPIADPFPPPAAPADNLSRNEPALHTNGDLTRSHYDMNMVAIDALFRHLLWTGDVEYARAVWPNIERHLAWERRLFRRTFGNGDDALPLYEGYANFWASDAVGYNGGGVAHASAMNHFHHRMAARVARLIGQDPTPYEREADLILQGMRRHLWLGRRGWFVEWKDLLGLQLVHDNAALWTFYHVIDSGAATPLEAWQMSRFVDTQLAHIPIGGGGGNYYTLPTTSWMPQMWSTNNVVVAESSHAALAMWQAGRDDEAFRLFKGNLLATMYAGLCPGNVGMCTTFDVLRGEAQRDFADGVGATSRALVEGLFGIRPDALAGELLLRPGFPAKWERASLGHRRVRVLFERHGDVETYVASFNDQKGMALRLQVPALRDDVAGVLINGKRAAWTCLKDEVGRPRIEVTAGPAQIHQVRIEWRGNAPAAAPEAFIAAQGERITTKVGPARPAKVLDPQDALSEESVDGDSVHAIATGELGHRTFFVRLEQGEMSWWVPMFVEIRPPIELIPQEDQPRGQLAFIVRNNASDRIEAKDVSIPPHGTSDTIIRTRDIVPGTNRVELDFGSRGKVNANVTNWRIDRPPASLEPLDLRPHFNDRVTQIFRNEYLAPRSPHVSLAVPKHGYGNWCKPGETFEVDDANLRRVADAGGGRIVIPPGIPFATPGVGDAKNVLFTSRWENYPAEASILLAGRASHVYLLMTGSTFSTLSQFDNGEVIVRYADGGTERLALRNPTTWWPIDQDYFIDDFAFRRPEPIPPRVHLGSGAVRVRTLAEFKGKGAAVPGGAATVLDLPLDSRKELRSLTVRALANEVVIGLMSATLARE